MVAEIKSNRSLIMIDFICISRVSFNNFFVALKISIFFFVFYTLREDLHFLVKTIENKIIEDWKKKLF